MQKWINEGRAEVVEGELRLIERPQQVPQAQQEEQIQRRRTMPASFAQADANRAQLSEAIDNEEELD